MLKPGPHAAMLHTCDGAFQWYCDGSKWHAMCCNRKFNMLNILRLISEYPPIFKRISALYSGFDGLSCTISHRIPREIFLISIAAMNIAGKQENIPSKVDDWPHCCDFEGDTCDGLRWAAMLLKATESQQNALFHRIVWPGHRFCKVLGGVRWGKVAPEPIQYLTFLHNIRAVLCSQ